MARAFSPAEKPERTADKATRRHNLRRVGSLFRAHRARLGAVLALIFLSAGLGMISPFLLRAVLDTAIPEKDTALLTALRGAADKRGYEEVLLEVREDNPSARRLYLRHGFAEAGIRRGYYQPSVVDAVVMRKGLR